MLELRTLAALSSEYEKQTELKSLLTQKLDTYVPREGPLDVRVRRAEEAVSLVSNDATKARLAEARRAIAEHLSARRTSELSEILDAFLGRLVQRWADGPSVSSPVSAPSISTSTRWRVTTNCGGSEFIPKSSTGGDISVLVTGTLTCGKYEKQVGTTLEDQYRRTERVCRTVHRTQTVGKTYNTDTNQWTGGHDVTVSGTECTGGELEVKKVEKPVYETYDTLQGAFEIRASGQSTSSKIRLRAPAWR